jgi:hypothetical protein
MVQVSRKTGRICQGGHQYRSSGANAQAVEYMRQGKLGDVKLARSIVYGGRGSIGEPGTYEVPAYVDYNLFLGPAPMVPLTRKNLHYDWHWVWDTGSGELGNNNVHSLDICRWGLGVTGLGRSVISYGGRMGYKDAGQTPNTQVCIFDFGDKTIVSETRGLKTAPFHPQYKGGHIFYGSKGIIAGGSVFDLEGNLVSTFDGKSENHFANFLTAVRSRKREDQKAEILEGHQSAALCHLGNISWRLGRPAAPAELREVIGKLTRTSRSIPIAKPSSTIKPPTTSSPATIANPSSFPPKPKSGNSKPRPVIAVPYLVPESPGTTRPRGSSLALSPSRALCHPSLSPSDDPLPTSPVCLFPWPPPCLLAPPSRSGKR